MPITLYAWDTPNARKISVALEEMAIPYDIEPIDIHNGAQFDGSFTAISPNCKIPAIVDPDTQDGNALSVFESGAILIYLAQKAKRYMPAEQRAQTLVMQWLMWQVGGLGPAIGQLHHFLKFGDGADNMYATERFQQETARLYAVLDRQLVNRRFVADKLSIADFSILGWVSRYERHLGTLAAYQNVSRWYECLMSRPAVRRGYEVSLTQRSEWLKPRTTD